MSPISPRRGRTDGWSDARLLNMTDRSLGKPSKCTVLTGPTHSPAARGAKGRMCWVSRISYRQEPTRPGRFQRVCPRKPPVPIMSRTENGAFTLAAITECVCVYLPLGRNTPEILQAPRSRRDVVDRKAAHKRQIRVMRRIGRRAEITHAKAVYSPYKFRDKTRHG